MTKHGIRTLRYAATVAALAIAQALGHHLGVLTKQLDTIRRQLEAVGAGKKKQATALDREVQQLEDQIKGLSARRTRFLEDTIPHRNRDCCEAIRLHSLSEVDRLMKQEPAVYLQQKWTARVFLMVHDHNVEVRLKALSSIASWFEKLKNYSKEVTDHLIQFAERCMMHLVERSRDSDTRVACKAIQMLRLQVLAERMTDEEVERIVNLVSCGIDVEVRQEAALFVNAQVFQDPGICIPEGRARKKRRGGATPGRDRDRGEDGGMSELSDAGDLDEEQRDDREAPDNMATLLNSETSISMFIEYLENYMGDKLRLTERPVNAFWNRAPCLSHWHTMVSLMILGESNKGPGLDPVSSRQRLILLHVMEAAVRRATDI
jgi:cell division protein FtsB